MPIDWVMCFIMCFIEKIDCKLFVSNRSVNTFSTYKSILILTLDFIADSCRES